ncbi:hypothetical protein [Roseateles depolymerans]|nr:hypothetical protein [Roseateles depolymerans]
MQLSSKQPWIGALLVGLSSACFGQAMCTPQEEVAYSCTTGTKTASLCKSADTTAPASLTYRYGRVGKTELEYVATLENARTFSAFTLPANPRAQIRMVWFDKGDFQYLMTECAGGSCKSLGRLAVFRGDRMLMNAECTNPPSSQPHFSRSLIQFGPDVDQAKSLTPLIKWEEMLFPIEAIYKAEMAPHGKTWDN